jgi:DNA uptake protein ComE-like DNA-binding protein
MKRFRKTVTALFGFERRERRGTFVLSLIVVVLVLVRLTTLRPGEVPAEIPPLPLEQDIATGHSDKEKTLPVLFSFDPNTCTHDDLLRLGLSARQARTLMNYRGSGARFRRPEDLKRVYGIDSATASMLIPYIIIGTDQERKNPGNGAGGNEAYPKGKNPGTPSIGYEREPVVKPSADHAENAGGGPREYGRDKLTTGAAGSYAVRLDINRCTAGELVTLPGIGPVLAERIIKYRSLLGGFVDKWQLAEVYGLDSSVAMLAAERIIMTFEDVRPLVLDSATYNDLARHPYLGYETARKITTYRSVTGSPVTLGRMVSSGVITPDQAARIAPYVRPGPGVTGTDYEFICSKVLK